MPRLYTDDKAFDHDEEQALDCRCFCTYREMMHDQCFLLQ